MGNDGVGIGSRTVCSVVTVRRRGACGTLACNAGVVLFGAMTTATTRGTTPVAADALNAVAARLDPARLLHDASIAPYTTFRIGGPADLLYDADTGDDLAHAIDSAEAAGVEWFVLGLGANILVGDGGFRGLVIRNRARHVIWHDDGRCDCEGAAHHLFFGTYKSVIVPSYTSAAMPIDSDSVGCG